jgi:hypothetical protein
MKQTALQWFIEQLINEEGIDFIPTIFVNQAKEMEKEQIIDAHNNGYGSGYMDEGISPEKFYNDTYGGNK